jgi:chitinase
VGPSCAFTPGKGISSWFTEAMFDEMFPNICHSACKGCGILTYECMVKATLMYPDFANSADEAANKREVAAWLGQMSQETTGGGCNTPVTGADGTCSCGPTWCDSHPGGCASWGLCFTEEATDNLYCSPSSTYPCVPGKRYSGRGPKQLSWNYNYGQFSESFCGDAQVLLDQPELVSTNPTLAWASSIWFWFTGGACNPGETCKPNCHEVFVGSKQMCAADVAAGRKYGYGWVTNIINGGLECGGAGGGACDYRVLSRVRFYKHFCEILGVAPLAAGWTEDNLHCAEQKHYVQSPPTVC